MIRLRYRIRENRGPTTITSISEVWFKIEDVTDEERRAFDRYGRPNINFIPGNATENEAIWRPNAQPAVAILNTPRDAQEHATRVCAEFVEWRRQLRERMTSEPPDEFTANSTLV